MRSIESVVQLWQDGHSAQVIARRLRVAPQTVYNALRTAGRGTIPERPWAGAVKIGIAHGALDHWVERGFVRKRGPLYNTDDVRMYVDRLEHRQCAHWRCENPVAARNHRTKFCDEHHHTGVDPLQVLAMLRLYPGLTSAQIYQKTGVTGGIVKRVLDEMIADGLLREEPIRGGRRLYRAED